jgi:NADPH:quinone reductase-like Zn-dependent oxidoreductase
MFAPDGRPDPAATNAGPTDDALLDHKNLGRLLAITPSFTAPATDAYSSRIGMEVAMTQSDYPASRRAAVLSDFGEASNLSVQEVATPALRSDEMLVRVKATSVNPIEWKVRSGLGLPLPKTIWRLLIGRPMILGLDFAGTVVATGPKVDGYRMGDDVMGAFRFCGADAEYAVVRPGDRHTAIALKPPSVSFAEAAAVPFAGLVALAGMTTHGRLTTKANPRVLVIGASGGVGHLAIQIAKHCMSAALVVGVCSSKNEDFARQCGADDVVAYDRTPIESIASHHPDWQGRFDLIFDAVGLDQAWTVLAPRLLSADGRFVAAALPQSADSRAGEDVGGARLALRRMGGRYRFIYGFSGDLSPKRAFPSLVRWLGEGKLAARLAATYSLDHLADAHRASEGGRTVGKISVVIP